MINKSSKNKTLLPQHEMMDIQPPARTGFIDGIMKLIREGYTTPHIYKTLLDSLILIALLACIVILMSLKFMDEHIGAVLLALLMGYIFGKIK